MTSLSTTPHRQKFSFLGRLRLDITLAELALEAFVPADDRTAQALRRMAAS